MRDAIVVGAGPAGIVAATRLARAGARVALLERATFPRHKLCGDTLNPGVLALLRRLGLASSVDARGLQIDGMIVTGEGGIEIEGRYPSGLHGRSLSRAELDWQLVQQATAAGVDFITGANVRGVVFDQTRGSNVTGVRVASPRGQEDMLAAVTIAADGRRSRLAFDLGLTRHPGWPRRWAIGAYATGVHGMSSFGEMHIRPGCYIGVAPLPEGVANICVVKPSSGRDPAMHAPQGLLLAVINADPSLRARFADARFVTAPFVLGPLSIAAIGGPVPDGLILAGDAAGFIDPMTGDGLRFAVQGGDLAASAAIEALEHGWTGVHARLAVERRRAFGAKWRFNRTLRTLVGVPIAVRAATIGAHLAPGVVRRLILRASDCDLVHSAAARSERAESLAPHASNSRG
jgi:flavin-dependent dehydrogenase